MDPKRLFKSFNCIKVLPLFLILMSLHSFSQTNINLALNKATSQSSTHGDGESFRAVDGYAGGEFSDNSVTHTKENLISGGDLEVWWQVDLGDVYEISRVEVYNRTDCCSERLDGAKIFLGANERAPSTYLTQLGEPLTGSKDVQIRRIDPGKKYARYVRIELIGDGKVLSLAEVKVFGRSPVDVPPPSQENVALGKTTSQSTTIYWKDGGSISDNAVDGNKEAPNLLDTAATEHNKTNPWWRVDLGAEYDISQIRVYKRYSCCSHDLEGAKLYVGSTDSSNPADYTQFNSPLINWDAPLISSVTTPIKGRYVMIHKQENDAELSIAEVEVYGELAEEESSVLPVVSLSHSDASGGLNNGSITFTFPDHPSRTGIKFSINGNSGYTGVVADNSGTYTFRNLAPGTYIPWVKWGDNSYPRALGNIFITDPENNQPVPDNLATGKKTAISGEDINDEQTLKVSRFTNDKDLDTAMLLRKSDLSENDLKGGFGYYIHLDVVRNIDYIKLTTGSEMTDGAIITVINTRLKGRDQYARQWRSTNAGVETFNKNQSTVRGDAIAISFAKGEETPDDVLHIAEIEVYGTGEEDENIALYKETYQSSTHKGNVSSNAVDGDINGNGENYVSHTQLDRNPYFGIKLDGVYRINRIEVYNRTDCCRDRIQGLKTFLIPPNQFEENISSYGFKALDDSLAGEVKDVYVGDHSLSTDGNYNETSEILFRFNDDESRYLHLAEVKVFGEFIRSKPVNVALGKSTSQSSTAYGGDSARAVDGNNNGNWFENSITHTNREDNPWWQVDLGAVHEIDYVYLYGRYGEIKELRDRIIGAQISIKEKLTDDWIVVGTIENYGEKIYDMYINLTQIAAGKKVRYMQVQIPKKSAILSISEFVAEGRLANQRSQISTRTSTSDLTNLELDSVVSLEEELSSTEGQAIQSQIVPNPNNGEFSVNYVAKQAGKVVFELYTAEGVLIHEKESRNDLKGASLSEKIIIPSNYPAGVYLLRVLFEDGDYYTLRVLKE